MIVERDITLYSTFEYHFVSIIGKAHIGYYSSGKVILLSKLNRIVQYYEKDASSGKIEDANCCSS